MKHIPTINNEIISYLCNIQDRTLSEENSFVSNLMDGQQLDKQSLPGKHVIQNILNYAKAMDVVHITNGEKMILLNN